VRTGLIYDTAYLNHNTGGHPESSNRVAFTYDILGKAGLLERLVSISPRQAKRDEVALVHSQEYIERVKAFSERGGGNFGNDVVGSQETYVTALLAAGGTLSAVDAVLEKQVGCAFAMVRPPGHHAMPNLGMGFCFFNNVSIAARYAIKKYGLSKILIIDWDEHHGNGTEHIFYNDPSVLYFSVHRNWSYPATGHADKAGEGSGLGYNINVPLPRRSGDADYEHVFRRILQPVALEYLPELVILSAGFDAHAKDPIGEMNLSTFGFMKLAEIVCEIASSCCGGALVSVLEGGYNQSALAESVLGVLHIMDAWDADKTSLYGQEKPVKVSVSGVNQVSKIHGKYWKL